jgi:hypothetical protein
MIKVHFNFQPAVAGLFLVFSIFTASALGQDTAIESIRPSAIDTALNPHDYNDETYTRNGVDFSSIVGRRNGVDGWSVFSYSSDPRHSDVRVTVTFPAYDHSGRRTYWYPLGDLYDNGFTPDRRGGRLQQIAQTFPIYVFPDTTISFSYSPTLYRQAAVIDNSVFTPSPYVRDPNPLGVHQLLTVNYTDAAFTREGIRALEALAKRNGLATDKTPIIKTTDEIKELYSLGYITFDDGKTRSLERPSYNIYRISPIISDPTNGVVANDAFLIMPMKDGLVPPAEMDFVIQFGCLRDRGVWCLP